MPFTPEAFAGKISALRKDRDQSLADVAAGTGIEESHLSALERGAETPSGDEILILASHFLCEFDWLIEDEGKNPDENLELLFRVQGDQLKAADKRGVAEFLYLCKCQALLDEISGLRQVNTGFSFTPRGSFFKRHGEDCAVAFRAWHDLAPNALIPDVFSWLRHHGFRVFRRALPASPISGLFVRHPVAGSCILVNGAEDPYRQRFSAAHEAGHALLDKERPFNVSDVTDTQSADRREIRANSFASAFLMPRELLQRMGESEAWKRPEKIIETADRLWVSVPALLTALRHSGLIDDATRDKLRDMRLRLPEKREPELGPDLGQKQMERKRSLLDMGLHATYVNQCLEAHRQGHISLGKAAEMLLTEPAAVPDLAALFGVSLRND